MQLSDGDVSGPIDLSRASGQSIYALATGDGRGAGFPASRLSPEAPRRLAGKRPEVGPDGWTLLQPPQGNEQFALLFVEPAVLVPPAVAPSTVVAAPRGFDLDGCDTWQSWLRVGRAAHSAGSQPRQPLTDATTTLDERQGKRAGEDRLFHNCFRLAFPRNDRQPSRLRLTQSGGLRV